MCFMELEKVKRCLPALTRCPVVVLWAGPPFYLFLFLFLQPLFALHCTFLCGRC